MAILDLFRNIFGKTTEKRAFTFDPNSMLTGGGSGIPVNNDTALTFSAVWAAIRILSESVAQLPISLIEREENGDKINRTNHPLYNLLHNKPNEYITYFSFIQKIMVDLCLNGNSYVKIERNGAGRPVALYPIDFDNVEIREYEDKYYYFNSETGEAIEYEEMLHFKTMSQDGMIGLSPIDTCANSISWGLGLEAYGNSYFSNGAKVSGVLETDRALSTEAVDRLRNSFDNNYSKIGDSNKTLILEEGLKFNSISMSNEASQFLASRQFSIEEVCRIFNVPPHMLADLSKSSFSNIQEQSREFVQYSLQPYLSMIEQEMTNKLFKKNETGKLFVEFNVNALLRGNPKDRAEYYRTMLNIGAISINEIRQKENMNRVEEGDSLFMQLNMTTVDKIASGVGVEEEIKIEL
jgi:HK97 family phage portal protein